MKTDLAKMAKLRAAAADELKNRIGQKRIHHTQGKLLLDDLEIGKKSPWQALHKMERMETAARQRIAWLSEHNLIPHFENYVTNCNDFPPRPDQCASALSMCRHVRIMTLYGPSGTGKTTAAARCVQYMAAVNALDSFVAVSGSKLSSMSTQELYDFSEIAMEAELLVIDDLDKGVKTEARAAALLEILSGREHAFSTTIITTNMVGAEFADFIDRFAEGYGMPIVNRLRRGFSIDFGPERAPGWFQNIGGTLRKLEKNARILSGDDDYKLPFRKLEWRSFDRMKSI